MKSAGGWSDEEAEDLLTRGKACDPDEFRANLELLRHPIPPALWQELKGAKLLHPDAPTPS